MRYNERNPIIALAVLTVFAKQTNGGRNKVSAFLSSPSSKATKTSCISEVLPKISYRAIQSASTTTRLATREDKSKTNTGNKSASETESLLDLSHYPNIRSFNLALEDIAVECSPIKKSMNIDVISRATIAEALVTKLENKNEDGSAHFSPDVVTYNSLMKVWARAAQTLSEGAGRGNVRVVMNAMDNVPEELTHGGVYTARDAAERAHDILSDLEEKYLRGISDVAPNSFGYNIVLDGLNKCGAKDSPQQVEELFRKMEKWSNKGVVSPINDHGEETYVHNHASDWAGIRPDSISYSIHMESLGLSTAPDALNKVDRLFASLEKKWEETGNIQFKPNVRVVNSVINAYLRNGSAVRSKSNTKAWSIAKKVHELLESTNTRYNDTNDKSFSPDITTFTMVIDAYARCFDHTALKIGLGLFDRANDLWEKTNDLKFKPSSKTFTVMINLCAKSRDPKSTVRAEKFLKQMEKMYEEDVQNGEGDSSQVKPSIRTYTAAIGAWTHSRDPSKAQRALRILKKVSDMYKETGQKSIKPTLYTYNAVIDACARCNGTPEQQTAALKIAFAVNKAILAAHLQPNHVTYKTLLNAAGKLVPPGDQRNEIITAVFSKCRNNGMVDALLLRAVEQTIDRTTFYDIMGDVCDRNGYVIPENIPNDWKRNVEN